MQTNQRSWSVHATLPALASLVLSCGAGQPPDGRVTQPVVSTPPPANLAPLLNARRRITVGAGASLVGGDVTVGGSSGQIVYEPQARQDATRSTLGDSIILGQGASVGAVYFNSLRGPGLATRQVLGVDPGALPAVPALDTAQPGVLTVTVPARGLQQLCAGAYASIIVRKQGRLNLNAGIYTVRKLILEAGARLEPSEPVRLRVQEQLSLGEGSFIGPYPGAALSAQGLRIEAAGAVSLGKGAEIRAHLLAPQAKVTVGARSQVYGAIWADDIEVGVGSTLTLQDPFAVTAPVLPAACDDGSACTLDECVPSGGGINGFCRNLPAAAGTSCADANVCNGDERCDAQGTCQPAAPPPQDDNNECTADSCDPVSGVSHTPTPGIACGDGNGICNVLGECYQLTCNADHWCQETPQQTNSLYGVWGANARAIWAVGRNGTIVHWDGLTWSTQASGTTSTLWGVWGSSATDVWAVGEDVVLRYDGAAWRRAPDVPIAARAVWGTGPNNVWVAGAFSNSTVVPFYRWNGVSWRRVDATVAMGFDFVRYLWGVDANNIWAVGNGSAILRWNGSTWLDQNLRTGYSNFGVWASDANNVWVAGWGGIYKWDGAAWVQEVPGLPNRFMTITGSDASHVWAVEITRGLASAWDGATWATQTTDAPANIYASWASDANHVWAVGDGGAILQYQR